MATLVLDPYLLAVPSIDEGRDAVLDYAESLVAWSALTGEPWLSLLKTDDTENALFEAGCFPATHAVNALCAALGIDEVSPEDVANALARLLQSAASCEDRCGVRDVLFDPSTLTPDLPSARRTEAPVGEGRNARAVREATRRLLWMHALLVHGGGGAVRNWELSSLDLFCGGAGVMVEGTLVILERGGSCKLPEWPDPYAVPHTLVRMCDGRDAALRALDAVPLWINGSDDARHAAVRITMMQLDPAIGWDDTDRFVFGCDFVKSLGRYGFGHEPDKARRLLESCAETVLSQNMRAVHALREGDGATAPQRMRGEHKAWRRDIDYEFHLHYWELAGRRFEFGNVVSHNVFTISYCQ
jgi:hypothetical protein